MSSGKKLIIALIIVLTSVVAITTAASFRAREKQSPQPALLAKQLPLVGGVIPVEIRDVRASFPKVNEVQDFSCITRNNTDKSITSVVLHYTIVTGNAGKELGDTIVLYRESFVHPDVREAHHYRPLVPGGEFTFESSGVTWFENAVVKRIEASVDYVEFEDKTKLGPDVKGSQIIGQLRQGAASYKNWLVQMYKQSGSVEAIVPLLQARDLPNELALKGMYVQQGAKVYRDHMLRVFNGHGSAEIEKYLNR